MHSDAFRNEGYVAKPNGRTIDRLREQRGMSQRKLAQLCGMSQGHLSKLLREKAPDTHGKLVGIQEMLSTSCRPDQGIEGLLDSVREMAEQSVEFRRLLQSAVFLAKKPKTDAN